MLKKPPVKLAFTPPENKWPEYRFKDYGEISRFQEDRTKEKFKSKKICFKAARNTCSNVILYADNYEMYAYFA